MSTDMLLFGAFALVTTISYFIFDQILKMEYLEFKSQWEIDGKPHGFFWTPPDIEKRFGGVPKFKHTLAFWRCSFVWTFITPEWIRKSSKAYKMLIILRIISLIGFIILIFFANSI